MKTRLTQLRLRIRRRQALALASCVVLIATAIVGADSWPGPRPLVFGSANGAYAFKTRPPQLATWSGKSHGTLLGLADGRETVTWTRELVNIPVSAFVAADGKHVVTFDTWAKLGHEHAMVIYGEQGLVIVDYGLDALLSREEMTSVIETVGGRRWLQDATIAFHDRDGVIAITLPWGKTIRVALATGRVETTR